MVKLLSLALIFLDIISISSLAEKPIPTLINVVSFGAKPDGSTDSTKAFLAAWNKACSSSKPTSIVVPEGRFLVKTLVFQGNGCKKAPITFRIAGTIIAPGDFEVIATQQYWISFQDVSDVSIIGGVIDAQGASLWKCKNEGKGNCPTGAKSLVFTQSNNINVFALTSVNSQKFHIVFDSCTNVNIDSVRVSADGESPNTDGIHLERSQSVRITNSRMATGDDCISMGPGTNHVFIQNIQCGPGHGISIGSLGRSKNELGVENITVSNIDFAGTTNGVRIKTWGKDSSSYARNIVFQHINMKNVKNPIIIDQHYCLNKPCPKQESGVKVSNVRYQDIRGVSNTEVAVMLDCSKEKPCTGIVMEKVNLVAVNQKAEASCVNVKGLANDVVPFTPCLKKE